MGWNWATVPINSRHKPELGFGYSRATSVEEK